MIAPIGFWSAGFPECANLAYPKKNSEFNAMKGFQVLMGVLKDRAVRERVFAIATVIVIVLIASHPELRLLVPLVDVMGIDVLVTLVAIQSFAAIKPFVVEFYCRAVLPILKFLYRAVIYSFGCMGPYVDARAVAHLSKVRVEA